MSCAVQAVHIALPDCKISGEGQLGAMNVFECMKTRQDSLGKCPQPCGIGLLCSLSNQQNLGELSKVKWQQSSDIPVQFCVCRYKSSRECTSGVVF